MRGPVQEWPQTLIRRDALGQRQQQHVDLGGLIFPRDQEPLPDGLALEPLAERGARPPP